jgi:hypothetical protein
MLKTENKKILRTRYPKATTKEYTAKWDKFLELGKKLNKFWKTDKTFLEILKEERIK